MAAKEKLVKRIGTTSFAQARRLIDGGRVVVNGEVVTDHDLEVDKDDKVQLQTRHGLEDK